MKGVLVFVLAVVLGIVGGALWCIVADSYATAAEPPKRTGVVERMREAWADRQHPVRERMSKLRVKYAERRDRRHTQGPAPAPVAVTPSQSGPASRAPRVESAARCPACGLVAAGG